MLCISRFYTLIPHDFGMATPPLLDSADLISTKTKMLETLLELEIAYSMTRTGVTSFVIMVTIVTMVAFYVVTCYSSYLLFLLRGCRALHK